jgi:hypothetical protein
MRGAFYMRGRDLYYKFAFMIILAVYITGNIRAQGAQLPVPYSPTVDDLSDKRGGVIADGRIASLMAIARKTIGLGKMAKSKSAGDSLIVSRIDTYLSGGRVWDTSWVIEFHYDAKGRMEKWNTIKGASEQMTFSYDDAGNVIQEKMQYTEDFSAYVTNLESCTDYYYGNHYMYSFYGTIGYSLPYFSIIPVKKGAPDSVFFLFRSVDSRSINQIDSIKQWYYFSYSDDSSYMTVTRQEYKPQTARFETSVARYKYFIGLDSLLSSVETYQMDDSGVFQLAYRTNYLYLDSVLMSTTVKCFVPGTVLGCDYSDFYYTKEGRLSWYTIETTNTLTPSRTPRKKIVYSYGPKWASAVKISPPSPRNASPKAMRGTGHLAMTVPDGVHIEDIRQFDPQGRLIGCFTPPFCRVSGEIHIPVKRVGNAMQLFRVRTNRGNLTLRVLSDL